MQNKKYNFSISKKEYNKIIRNSLLTDKEKQCLDYIMNGLKMDEIAKKMNCSTRTINRLKEKIFLKLKDTKLFETGKNYSVYMLVFPNNKVYIGKTSRSVNERWENGLGYRENDEMYADIQKYGWENIEKKILYKHLTANEAQQKENETIVIYKSYIFKYGYNKKIIG